MSFEEWYASIDDGNSPDIKRFSECAWNAAIMAASAAIDSDDFVYAVVEKGTDNIINGELIVESGEGMYELVGDVEWRKFMLVPCINNSY